MKFGQLIDMIHTYDSLIFLKSRAETRADIFSDTKQYSKEAKEEIKLFIKKIEELREMEIGEIK